MAVNLEGTVSREVNLGTAKTIMYHLFSEQFLEKPGRYELGTGFTVCTIMKIPAFDDW